MSIVGTEVLNPMLEVDQILRGPIARLRGDKVVEGKAGPFALKHDGSNSNKVSFVDSQDPSGRRTNISYFMFRPHYVYRLEVSDGDKSTTLVRGAIHESDHGEVYPRFSFGWALGYGGLISARVDIADRIGFKYEGGGKRESCFGDVNGQRGWEWALDGIGRGRFTDQELESYRELRDTLPRYLRGQQQLLDRPVLWNIDSAAKAEELISASRVREFAAQFK